MQAIFFESLYRLENNPKPIGINLKDLEKNPGNLQETWRIKINLMDLNFFEQLEHLEIKVRHPLSHRIYGFSFSVDLISLTQGIGKVFGRLKIKNLKILSVESVRLSEFDLDCEQLKVLHISFGARPNFISLSD